MTEVEVEKTCITKEELKYLQDEYPTLPLWVINLATKEYYKDPEAFKNLDWDKIEAETPEFGGSIQVRTKEEVEAEDKKNNKGFVEGADAGIRPLTEQEEKAILDRQEEEKNISND